MVIKVEGYGKLLKFLEGVLKIDLIARTLYHFEGNWASSFYNRGPKVETWAGIHFMWEYHVTSTISPLRMPYMHNLQVIPLSYPCVPMYTCNLVHQYAINPLHAYPYVKYYDTIAILLWHFLITILNSLIWSIAAEHFVAEHRAVSWEKKFPVQSLTVPLNGTKAT